METEKILLQVEFNSPEIAAQFEVIKNGRVEIDKLQAANKALADQGKKNSTQFIQNEQAIKKLNTEINSSSRIIQANTQANKSNSDSIEDLRKKNSELVKERNKLSTATEEGRKQIDLLNTKIDANNETIAKNSSSLEKQRLNIGNYAGAVDKLLPGFEGLRSAITGAQTALTGVSKAFNVATLAELAFIAPIVVLIAIGVALSAFFTRTEKGADIIGKIFAQVAATINVLLDRLASLGEALSSLSLDGIAKAFSGVGDEIAREVQLAGELADILDDLEDRELANSVALSKSTLEVKRLLIESKNRNLSEQDRIDLLDQASKLELKASEQTKQIKKDALDAATKQIELDFNQLDVRQELTETEAEYAERIVKDSRLTVDARKVVAKALEDLNTAEGESLNIQEKIQNQKDALADKAADAEAKRLEKAKADREKREAEILKAAENERQAIFKLSEFRQEISIKEEKDISARVEKEKALAKFRMDFLLENDKLIASERELITAQYEASVTAITQKGVDERDKIQKDAYKKFQDDQQKQLDDQINSAAASLEFEVNALKEKVLAGTLSKQDYDAEVLAMDIALNEAAFAIKEQYGEYDVALAGQITDAKIAQKEKEKNTEIALEKAKFAGIKSIIDQSAALLNKNSLAYKALAIAQATINTYQAASLALASFPPPFGAIAAGLTVIQGLLQVKNIVSTTVPKMAKGGVISIGGKDHAQGGEDVSIGGQVVANVQGGEKMVVLKRGVNSSLLQALGNINERAGGVNFYNDRAPKRHLADGGFVARSTSSPVNESSQSISDMFLEGVSKIQIITRISDIERVQNQKNKATKVSSLQ